MIFLKVKIAGVLIEFSSPDVLDWHFVDSFLSTSKKQPDISANINFCPKIHLPQGETLMDENLVWIRKLSKNPGFIVYQKHQDTNEVINLLDISDNCTKATFFIKRQIQQDKTTIPLVDVLFRNLLLYHEGIVLHASAIKWRDKAILFTAPSGTGKTTMAYLWKHFQSASVLNGDNGAIRIVNNQPIVYGTPWSGSKPEFINDNAPLRAIIVLEQSLENRIRQLSTHEYISALMPRFYLPYYDSTLLKKAIATFDKIARSVPIFLLKCRPDNDAVKVTLECLL